MNHIRRIFVTDCEGPLSRNDNALEIAERFIPAGDELFARLSRYDDFLADVEQRPGYNAGDTLRLLPPFLLAYEVSDEEVEQFSAENVLLVPGVLKLIDELTPLLPAYVISTSYTPYLRALCDVTRFPFEHVRCTDVTLDARRMPQGEKEWLREQALAILARPVIDIPEGATSMADLSPRDQRTVGELNQLFWYAMEGLESGRMLDEVRPIGGGAKLTELLEVAAENETTLANVMYVGDSITDVPALNAVRDEGGVALSFNGNAYALAAAEFAAASADVAPTIDLAKSFARGGREAVIDAVRLLAKAEAGRQAQAARQGGGGRRHRGRGGRRARRGLRQGPDERTRRARRPPRLTARRRPSDRPFTAPPSAVHLPEEHHPSSEVAL